MSKSKMRLLPALVLTIGLTLTACGGGDGDDGSEGDASSTPTPTSTVPVPDDVELTNQGSELAFGDSANVIFEPNQKRGSALELTVERASEGSLDDFSSFALDDPYERRASYFYVDVKVKNVGEGDVGGVPVPLWGVSGENVLLPAVQFTTNFTPCPSESLPKKFAAGDSFSTCLVYLSPDKGTLEAVSYRPDQTYDPITWAGDIEKAPSKEPKKQPSKNDKG